MNILIVNNKGICFFLFRRHEMDFALRTWNLPLGILYIFLGQKILCQLPWNSQKFNVGFAFIYLLWSIGSWKWYSK